MSQLIKRLLVFFIGTPLVVSLALFDIYNYLPLHLITIAVMFMAARELYTLLKTKLYMQPKWLFIITIVFIPITTSIVLFLSLPTKYIYFFATAVLMFALAYEVFSPDNSASFENAAPKLCTTAFGIIYIGIFSTYILQLTVLPNASILMITFMLMVFACDSLAWFFGMLLGKNNRGYIKASPNKSIAGFLGGIFGSVLAGVIMFYFNASVFSNSLALVIITGVLVAFASIAGDLIESVLKRSCEHKDSDIAGVGIPGRGGFLDSIDSILFSAPVFYILVNIFFI